MIPSNQLVVDGGCDVPAVPPITKFLNTILVMSTCLTTGSLNKIRPCETCRNCERRNLKKCNQNNRFGI
jgi:hypothetical protein